MFTMTRDSGALSQQNIRIHDIRVITSAEEGGYVFGSVCLSVCLSVCPSDYSQTCERILTKFFGGVSLAQGPSDTILVVIRITLRIRESKVRNPDPLDRRRFVLSEHIFLVKDWNINFSFYKSRVAVRERTLYKLVFKCMNT